ncbi:MAG: divergent polysaccharide deacetylase family protein [Rhodospirillales bacterium]|nr:divergent polysaccharide deacetylase family protein [Rhodospirillales bacterium]
MKFPKLFGKKSSNDDDDFDDDFDDDNDDEVAGDEPATDDDETVADDGGGGDDDDGDDDYDDFDDEDEDGEDRGPDRRMLLLGIGGGSLAVMLVVGGVAWWLLGDGNGDSATAEETAVKDTPGHIVLDIPPRPRPNQGRLRPQNGQKLTATETLNAIAASSEGPGAGIVVAPVQLAAFGNIPTPPATNPLSKTPDAGLVEQSPQGPLPIVGQDGRKPWRVYARPFDEGDTRPRVAVVFSGLGMSRSVTEAAIKHLPPEITLAFDPHAAGLHDWVAMARNAGHEVLLGIPMEPTAFPAQDPGPMALMTNMSPGENLRRLETYLSRLSGYVGIVSLMGSRFTQEEDQMRPVLDLLNSRGLMFVDSLTSDETVGPAIAKEISLPLAMANLKFDRSLSRAALGRLLAELERAARENKGAIAVAKPYPATIAGVVAWAGTLAGKNIALAPVSAIANRQPIESQEINAEAKK